MRGECGKMSVCKKKCSVVKGFEWVVRKKRLQQVWSKRKISRKP
jgi:hypothetical protein